MAGKWKGEAILGTAELQQAKKGRADQADCREGPPSCNLLFRRLGLA
jgi:hypothetical protein